MTWAALQLPEDQLAAMLVECQPVRAIVAYPAYTWSQLAAVLDAGTVSAGSTADKVTTSAFIEDETDSAYIARPRFAVSHHEADGYSRMSVSGFDLTGRLYASMELQIPPSLLNDMAAAKSDMRFKALAIETSLLQLPRAYPRLDLESVNVEAGVVYPQEHNGERFGLIQMDLTYRGSI